jgi:predicted lipid-binding transport protein (Tim44 family)
VSPNRHPDSLPGRVVAVHGTLGEARRTVERLARCRFPAADVNVRPRQLTFVPHEDHPVPRAFCAVLAVLLGGALAGGLAAGRWGAVLGGLAGALLGLAGSRLVRTLRARRARSTADARPAGYAVADSFEVVVTDQYAADALRVLAASRRRDGMGAARAPVWRAHQSPRQGRRGRRRPTG